LPFGEADRSHRHRTRRARVHCRAEERRRADGRRRAGLELCPSAARDATERARRQDRLQRAEATFDPLSFDGNAARAYGRVFAAVASTERTARGARAVDLLVAATALATELPRYTRNGKDFTALDGLVDVTEV
jgi:hypothetical protein